jgi:hypothetical protein
MSRASIDQMLIFAAAVTLRPARAADQASNIFALAGVVQRLAPLHLLHQEFCRHGGVVLGVDRRAVELAQIGGALERVLQALVRLVDAHRPLHGHALRGSALALGALKLVQARELPPGAAVLSSARRSMRPRPSCAKAARASPNSAKER